MPRKKSASKRAAQVQNQDVLASEKTEKNEISTQENSIRKEVHLPNQSEDESYSSSTDEEDEFGELITDEVEKGISQVLNAIKSKDQKLFDPNTKFFEDPENAVKNLFKTEKHKPMYLKDYHRLNLLSGKHMEDEQEEEYPENEKPFAIQQKEDRNRLVSEINNAFQSDDDEEDEDNDGFLQKKERPARLDEISTLPDPNQDPDQFLNAFIDGQAWIPKKGDTIVNLDKTSFEEDDEEFDDAAEKFEQAYNFRFEDPRAAEIISYARTQATSRRSETNSRKKKREQQKEGKKKEEEVKQEEISKKKKSKVNKVLDRLKQIKDAVGGEVSDELINKVFGDSLLNDDFDDADWNNKMAEIFNEQYYSAEVSKPEWDEDDELMADFYNKKEESGNSVDDEEQQVKVNKEEYEEDEENKDDEPERKKSKKDKLKEKKSKKKEKDSLLSKAEKIVSKNVSKIVEEVEEERGRSKENEDIKFKYREVSPESFGLSTREILLANDQQLNEFIGLKKFAPYRPKELRVKDKRKLTKKKHLKEWRKQVFKSESGPKAHEMEDEENDIVIPLDQPTTKSKKRKHK